MAEVVRLTPVYVGEGYRFDHDELLEAAKGRGFEKMMIVGELLDGKLWVSGSANAGETLILLERAKHQLVFPSED